jgi:large conductance mechanosensitive channel
MMLKGFREFLMKGNIIDLAVAVVIGAAFGALVSSLVENLLTPSIAALVNVPNFSGLKFTINGSEFLYGKFFNSLISFLLISASIYFFVVVPVSRMTPIRKSTPSMRPCPECLSQIPLQAHRCAHCTSVVESIPSIHTGT